VHAGIRARVEHAFARTIAAATLPRRSRC
jgi:hypothetical protein